MPTLTVDRSCSPSSCNDKKRSGASIAVYEKGSDCTVRLTRNRAIKNPSIPIQLTENNVELRDGSSEFPIKLPGLEVSNLSTMAGLIGVMPDGKLVWWKFGNFDGKKKLAVKNGVLTIEEDYGSDVIAATICAEDSCNALDGLIGYKTIVNRCQGEPDRVMTQLCLAPKCCCPTSEAESCEACEAIDAIINPEEV